MRNLMFAMKTLVLGAILTLGMIMFLNTQVYSVPEPQVQEARAARVKCYETQCQTGGFFTFDKDGVTLRIPMRQRCDERACYTAPNAPIRCFMRENALVCDVPVSALTADDPGPGQYAVPCDGQCPKGCSADLAAQCQITFTQ